MLGTTQQNTKHFRIIECILYACFCILSAYFMWGVLDKYFSRQTSFTQSEELINEFPTITLCFTNSKKLYEYETDFEIIYGFFEGTDFHNTTLKEGKYSSVLTQNLSLTKIQTFYSGICHKISVLSGNMKQYTQFILNFNESIPHDELPTVDIHITSEKNSYGIATNAWINGRVMHINTQIEKGISKIIDLKPEKHNYLAINSICSDESFYDCFSRLFGEKLERNQRKCSPISLPSLPLCKLNDTSYNETYNVFLTLWDEITSKELCPKLCTTLEYSGQVTSIPSASLWNGTFIFLYKFLSSNSTTVYNEYLIYDAVSMIGSVGGSLGLCIGFSFTGMVSCLINIIQNKFMVGHYEQENKNSEKLQPLNDMMTINERFIEQEKLNMKIMNELEALKSMQLK